jgi:hypothetical protein
MTINFLIKKFKLHCHLLAEPIEWHKVVNLLGVTESPRKQQIALSLNPEA